MASGHANRAHRPNTWLHRPATRREILLANPEPSTHGTTVWTGRALQARFDDLEAIGLALLYPALEWNACVRGHHGYPRASDLILGKALKGRSCHQIRDATARPFLHLLNPTRRPRQELLGFVSCYGSAKAIFGLPRSLVRLSERQLRPPAM